MHYPPYRFPVSFFTIGLIPVFSSTNSTKKIPSEKKRKRLNPVENFDLILNVS